MFKEIQKSLKILEGKKFIYFSKYGTETQGIVDEIILTSIPKYDKETERKLRIKLHQTSPSPKFSLPIEDKLPIEVPFAYKGWKIEINVISTQGVLYNLMKDKIYFIDE